MQINLIKEEYTILIVDDHKMFREGLSYVISQMKGFKVVGQASYGYSILELLSNHDVDIVLMDISMFCLDGIIAMTKSLIKYSGLKIIVLSMNYNKELYRQMIQAEVSGYLLKESGRDELEKALKTVITGGRYYPYNIL